MRWPWPPTCPARACLLPDNGLAFARVLATHTALRNLTEAVVFDPATLQVIAHAGYTTSFTLDPPPEDAISAARLGEVAVLPAEDRVRAVVALDFGQGWMLLIGRPLDTTVLMHQHSVEQAVAEYVELDDNRSGLQVTFVMIFAIAALLVLLAAVLIGLVLANQLARPIGRLIVAAERVRGGDLSTRVEEGAADEEVASLARAFNRMTNQLAAQRSELLQAYRQIDDRRRFTETVLAGVSAGVVGLEADGRINLPNRRASELLGLDLDAAIGQRLAEVVPEFAELLAPAPCRWPRAPPSTGRPSAAAPPRSASARRATAAPCWRRSARSGMASQGRRRPRLETDPRRAARSPASC